jgi:hypothetical protein
LSTPLLLGPKEWVDLYLSSPYVPSWRVQGKICLYLLLHYCRTVISSNKSFIGSLLPGLLSKLSTGLRDTLYIHIDSGTVPSLRIWRQRFYECRMDSTVRRESQVSNFVVSISCRTRSGVPKAYGSLKDPLHATRLFLPIAMPCTFFLRGPEYRRVGSVVHRVTAALSRFMGSFCGFRFKQNILYNSMMAMKVMKHPKCLRNSESS